MRVGDAPRLRVRELRLLERPFRLRIPFRYGRVTLHEARQAFVHARVETSGGASAWGLSAEVLAPKWFDKNPTLGDADNVDQLRASLALAARRYVDDAPASAFALMANAHEDLRAETVRHGLPALAAGFGPALIDRAVLDALCRIVARSFFDAVRANVPGIEPARVAPDLAGFDVDAFLAALAPRARVHARHTVGLADPLDAAGCRARNRIDDGLPETLEEAVRRYGYRFFKLKIGGDVDADARRLGDVARVLDAETGGDYRVTLDGNEQYASPEAVAELLERLRAAPARARLYDAVLFVEQPIARARALAVDVSAIAAHRPVIIDESDDAFDAFFRARDAGYDGVSSKQCKGLYKSIVNAARCAAWNAEIGRRRHFLSGEDLACQGGIAVQQDLALAALLGIGHVERNGHYFGGAMPGAAPAEHEAFLAAHPDVYESVGDRASLRITGGEIALGSLERAGFAHGVDPDLDAMEPMPVPG